MLSKEQKMFAKEELDLKIIRDLRDRVEELEQQLAEAEAAGAAMREALRTAERRLQCSPGNRDVIDIIYTALETDIGKTTLARIGRLESALESCRDQFAFQPYEVGWRLRLQEEIDEALKGATE